MIPDDYDEDEETITLIGRGVQPAETTTRTDCDGGDAQVAGATAIATRALGTYAENALVVREMTTAICKMAMRYETVTVHKFTGLNGPTLLFGAAIQNKDDAIVQRNTAIIIDRLGGMGLLRDPDMPNDVRGVVVSVLAIGLHSHLDTIEYAKSAVGACQTLCRSHPVFSSLLYDARVVSFVVDVLRRYPDVKYIQTVGLCLMGWLCGDYNLCAQAFVVHGAVPLIVRGMRLDRAIIPYGTSTMKQMILLYPKCREMFRRESQAAVVVKAPASRVCDAPGCKNAVVTSDKGGSGGQCRRCERTWYCGACVGRRIMETVPPSTSAPVTGNACQRSDWDAHRGGCHAMLMPAPAPTCQRGGCDRTQFVSGGALLPCTRCGSAFYCSTACNVSDWKTHRPTCFPRLPAPEVGSPGDSDI